MEPSVIISWSTTFRGEKKDADGNISKKRFIEILKKPEEGKYPLKKIPAAWIDQICELLWASKAYFLK